MFGWLKKPKPLIKELPARIVLLFSKRPFISHYLIPEIESDIRVSELVRIAGAFSNDRNASTGIFKMKNIECKFFDEKTFFEKHSDASKNLFIERISKSIMEYKPTIIVSDFFSIKTEELAKYLSVPIIEAKWASIDGTKLVIFEGLNCVRDAILSGRREMNAGAFLTYNSATELKVFSKPLQIDLARLSEIKTSDDFEKFVNITFEKFVWSCAGPAVFHLIKMLVSQKIAMKEKSFYIGDGTHWVRGFYNMLTEHVQGFYGLTD